MFGADFLKCSLCADTVYARHQAQEAKYREWQGRVDVQLLRHVTDAQLGLAPYAAAVGLEQAKHGTHQGGLAGAIWADQGNDLPRLYAQCDVIQHALPGERDPNLLQSD